MKLAIAQIRSDRNDPSENLEKLALYAKFAAKNGAARALTMSLE